MVEPALTVDGWMERSELEWLYDTARSMPGDAIVVEVGCWKGKSTVALCEGLTHSPGAQVWAVDTFLGDAAVEKAIGQFDSQSVLDEFRRNTARYANLQLLVSQSVQASSEFDDGTLDWIFVDADHAYDAVVADIVAWAPKLKPDGLLSGHDYQHGGVQEAVLRSFGTVSRGAGSIWYTRSRPRSAFTIAARRRLHRLRALG